MLIFCGLKNVPKVQFPSGVVVQVSKGGSMNTELLEYRLQNVWKRRKNSLCRQPAVLVLDRHASHLHARIQNQLMREHQTRAIYVPAGMTPLRNHMKRAIRPRRKRTKGWQQGFRVDHEVHR